MFKVICNISWIHIDSMYYLMKIILIITLIAIITYMVKIDINYKFPTISEIL